MSDMTNLLYNGDMTHGTECYNGGTVSNNIWSKTGYLDLVHSQLIPISPTDTYKISWDLRVDAVNGTNPLYIALHACDSDKNFIPVNNTLQLSSSAPTTLASALKNGDTTATLSLDSTAWDVTSYSRLGICDNLAWGYNRARYSQQYTARSGAVLTFKSAWAGGTIATGTKVNKFSDGSTYCYPWILSSSNFPTTGVWTHYECTFTKSSLDCGRGQFTNYIQFGMLLYNHGISLRNIKIENTTRLQYCEYKNSSNPIQLSKTGVISNPINEIGMPIRYIKDEINGSTANAYNHWVEIQAYDYLGNNIAYNKYAKYGSGSYGKSYVTDGSTTTSPYDSGTSPCVVDLGFLAQINKITVWHYWGDGRTYYEHKISVSADGSNWVQVYSGQQAETSSGISVELSKSQCSFDGSGIVNTREITEY